MCDIAYVINDYVTLQVREHWWFPTVALLVNIANITIISLSKLCWNGSQLPLTTCEPQHDHLRVHWCSLKKQSSQYAVGTPEFTHPKHHELWPVFSWSFNEPWLENSAKESKWWCLEARNRSSGVELPYIPTLRLREHGSSGFYWRRNPPVRPAGI